MNPLMDLNEEIALFGNCFGTERYERRLCRILRKKESQFYTGK
jgi:Ran GTPase-activating protein (RanGAP) involved in mRNA processing and transport